jgi:primary-amine oxidase
MSVFCLQLVYNHQIFPDIDSFLEAYHNGTLQRLPSRPDQKNDTDWSTRHRPKGEPRDLDHLPGPRQVSFAGLRFRVNKQLQYVSWLGWGLYLGFDRDMGLSLWDIRFLGDRIAYEVCKRLHRIGRSLIRLSAPILDRTPGCSGTIWCVEIPDSERCCAKFSVIAGNDPMQTTTAWLDRFFGMVWIRNHINCAVSVALTYSCVGVSRPRHASRL